ncbi:MAG: hypothetical protein AAFU71_02840 [Cyanobacteria bacterium J06632_22]
MSYLHRIVAPTAGLIAATLTPLAAVAQTPITDNEVFLDGLYSATAEYDQLAHDFAVEMGDDNIELASMVCAMFDEGAPAIDGLGAIFSGINSGFYEGGAEEIFTADQIDNASFVYSVALVSFGTDAYCPEYTPNVIAALEDLES